LKGRKKKEKKKRKKEREAKRRPAVNHLDTWNESKERMKDRENVNTKKESRGKQKVGK
jgi:hypothetical protein